MKKILLFTCCVILAGAFVSCGGGSSEKSNKDEEPQNYVLNPKTKSITGPLGRAYEVNERTYKVKKNYGSYIINVELALTNPSSLPSGFNSNRVGTHYDNGNAQYPMLASFIIEYLDEDGNIIETFKPNNSDYKDLMRLSEGESSSVSFYVPDEIDEIKYFRIKSDYYPNEIKEEVKKNDIPDIMSMDDEELNQTLEQAGKAVETAGKMVETAGEIMKELNNLTN